MQLWSGLFMQQLACYQSKGGRNEVDAGTKVSGSMHGRKHAMGGQQASRVAPAGPKRESKSKAAREENLIFSCLG